MSDLNLDTKLHTSVRYGNPEAVLCALKENHDPNQIGMLQWTPVHEAAHNGEKDILKLLLHYGGEQACYNFYFNQLKISEIELAACC